VSGASTLAYPDSSLARDRWVLQHRAERHAVDPRRPYAQLIEEERADTGEAVSIATIFLTNRECPWRCLMCDLWKNTLTDTVEPGAIPAQIDWALNALNASETRPRQVKLYNSGSFFDPKAIPPEDYPAIAERVKSFERVIVECHPALVTERILPFRDRLAGSLEIAMGLETVHPYILPRLNKRMSVEQFARAADFLHSHGIGLRVFVLVKPPFLAETDAVEWAARSTDFAFDCRASVVSIIPTRLGNGAMEALQASGDFSPPTLQTFEHTVDYGIGLRRGRVFGDLWDLEKFSGCPKCFPERRARLLRMNRSQVVEPRAKCSSCGKQE